MSDQLLRGLSLATGAACAGIGAVHALWGGRSVIGIDGSDVNEDSQERFYGAMFAAYGCTWLAAANRQPLDRPVLRALAGAMAAGGAARLLGIARTGRPHPFWVGMTAVEIVAPAVVLWVAREPSAA
jgi:hypothetical protein